MPVRIRVKYRAKGTVSPPALNQETDIINLGELRDDYIVEGQISLQNMDSGDQVVLRSYIAVDGATKVQSDKISFIGAQEIPVVRFLAHTLPYDGRLRVTITQTAGTLRSFPYCFIVQETEFI